MHLSVHFVSCSVFGYPTFAIVCLFLAVLVDVKRTRCVLTAIRVGTTYFTNRVFLFEFNNRVKKKIAGAVDFFNRRNRPDVSHRRYFINEFSGNNFNGSFAPCIVTKDKTFKEIVLDFGDGVFFGNGLEHSVFVFVVSF